LLELGHRSSSGGSYNHAKIFNLGDDLDAAEIFQLGPGYVFVAIASLENVNADRVGTTSLCLLFLVMGLNGLAKFHFGLEIILSVSLPIADVSWLISVAVGHNL
jgi:hypothetical protein